MKLFNLPTDANQNLLPKDGMVRYFGPVYSLEAANAYLDQLLNQVAWRHDEAVIFGKRIITKRKVAWYGDAAFEYTYSNTTKKALPWTRVLYGLKAKAEEVTQSSYNSCLINLYHNGSEGMAWHSDAEKDLQKHGTIASLSFGAQRKFAFKHKTTSEKVDIQLEHGSLLSMGGCIQDHWLHRLPPTKKVHSARVNLTFRTIVNTKAER